MNCVIVKWTTCLLFVVSMCACTPSGVTVNSASEVTAPLAQQVLANPLEKKGQVNPLEKEGQIARIVLRVNPSDLATPPPNTLDVNADGFLMVQENAPFTILSDQGKNRFTGQVKANTLSLPVDELGEAPYRIEVTLPGDNLMVAELNDELLPEEMRVLTAKQVRIVNTQTCGNECTQVNGDVNVIVNDVNANVNCIGVTVNCEIAQPSPQPSPPQKEEP